VFIVSNFLGRLNKLLQTSSTQLAILDELSASCHAERRRPIFSTQNGSCFSFFANWWTMEFFPLAESLLVNSNFPRTSRMQGMGR